MEKARRTYIQVYYKGKKLDQWINGHVESFTYEDVAAGESDSLSLSLQDIDKKWIGAWKPIMGDIIHAAINDVNHGMFVMDDISFSGRPMTCNIKAVATPLQTGFKKTKVSRTWEKVSVEEIAKGIAAKYGLSITYDAPTVIVDSLEQSEKSDSEFLAELCKKYGLSMKVYAYKIIIYDDAEYEKKQAIKTIDESEMLSWSYNATLNGTYTGGKIQYTNPGNEKTIDLVVGESARLYESTEKADTLEDAKRIVISAVNEANKEAETLSFSVPGLAHKIYASQVINITGLESANGKYFINKVSHSVGGGYILSVEARKIQKRITIGG